MPLAAFGDGADREDIGIAGTGGLEIDKLGGRLAIESRLSVRHTRDRGDAARQRRCCPGGDRLVLLASRLTEVDMHVDQSGADDFVLGINRVIGLRPGLRP